MNTTNYLFLAVASVQQIFYLPSYALQYLPQNIPVTTEPSNQASPTISIDPNNQNHLVATWDDMNGNGYLVPGFSFSTDGGNTWSPGSEITNPDGYSYGFNTSSGIDRNANAYCTFTTRNSNFGPPPLQVCISVSSNNGSSWTTYPVSPKTSYQDKPYMAIDNTNSQDSGRIYVAWTDLSDNPDLSSNILISHSTNHGQNWSSPYLIVKVPLSAGLGATLDPYISGNYPPTEPLRPFVHDATPVVGPDGTVYVVYLFVQGNGHDLDPASICYVKSSDGGNTFTPPPSHSKYPFCFVGRASR